MATYVFSDVHGHLCTLERLLDRVSPAADDRIIMLGDMIDRGPDSVGVMRTCYKLAQEGATVLRGNHEDLMLDYFDHPHSGDVYSSWANNGGCKTAACLKHLKESEIDELLDWVRSLPLYTWARVGGRLFFLSHAGINPFYGLPDIAFDEEASDQERIEAIAQGQTAENLLWVRYEFWGAPTGLIDEKGNGIIVIAGHTPTHYLETMADCPDRPGTNEEGLGQMVRVGACDATGYVADRWDIDAGCARGAGSGRLLLLRLDDGEEFYENVLEGE